MLMGSRLRKTASRATFPLREIRTGTDQEAIAVKLYATPGYPLSAGNLIVYAHKYDGVFVRKYFGPIIRI